MGGGKVCSFLGVGGGGIFMMLTNKLHCVVPAKY